MFLDFFAPLSRLIKLILMVYWYKYCLAHSNWWFFTCAKSEARFCTVSSWPITHQFRVGIVIPGSRTFFSIPKSRDWQNPNPGISRLKKIVFFSWKQHIFHAICYKLKMTSLVTHWQWHSSVLLQPCCKLQLLSSIPGYNDLLIFRTPSRRVGPTVLAWWRDISSSS